MFLWIILCNIPLTQQRFQPSWFKVLPSALPIFIRFYPYIMKFWKHGKNCLPWSNFLQSDCKTLHTFEPLYNGHLGDRRKWPLLRGGHCREVLNKESMCEIFCPPWLKKVALVERWLLVQVRLYYTFLSYNVSPSLSFEHRRSVKMQEMPLEKLNLPNFLVRHTPDPPRGPHLRCLYEYLRR